MDQENKSIFDPNLHPLPDAMRQRLDIVSRSFFTARMRNLDMLQEKDRRMYGYMTYYDGNGYCWIQPMATKNHQHDVEYDRYIKRINQAARENKLGYLDKDSVKVGMDVVAQYEVDRCWYRAMVVEQYRDEDEAWKVMFADFGNIQRCELEEIRRPIHEKDCDHYHSALQAVCCRLYNIVPTSEENIQVIDMALTDFYAKSTTQILELYVRNIRPDYVVDCDVFLPKRGVVGEDRVYRRHVGQFLVDEGVASFADPVNARAIKLPQGLSKVELVTIDENKEIKSEDVKPDIKILTTPRVVQFSV